MTDRALNLGLTTATTFTRVKLYTFGQPRVADKPYAQMLESRIGERFRITNRWARMGWARHQRRSAGVAGGGVPVALLAARMTPLAAHPLGKLSGDPTPHVPPTATAVVDANKVLSDFVRGVEAVRAGLPTWLSSLIPNLTPLAAAGYSYWHWGPQARTVLPCSAPGWCGVRGSARRQARRWASPHPSPLRLVNCPLQIMTLDYINPQGAPVRRTFALGNELRCADHDLDRCAAATQGGAGRGPLAAGAILAGWLARRRARQTALAGPAAALAPMRAESLRRSPHVALPLLVVPTVQRVHCGGPEKR